MTKDKSADTAVSDAVALAAAGIRENLKSATVSLSDSELGERIEKELRACPEIALKLSPKEISALASGIFGSMRGFGPLDPLLEDPEITEIMVNGADRVFVERGGRVEPCGVRFENEKTLEDIIQRIVGLAGREVNRANPVVDTRLPDGARVNVVLPPLSVDGAVMTVRRFPSDPMTLERLISLGSLTAQAADALSLLVKARYNIFISGGTGSGKTTFLGALTGCIPPDERIITIEDSAELSIKGIPNLVRLETRNANSSGSGRVGISELIRASLRMRPERIIVGEVRGPEALDMLQAMNTGHDGSISTGHANSSADMFTRLETMVLQGGSSIPLDAVRAQIASAIDIIVHLSRMRDKSRRTVEISEVAGVGKGRGKQSGGGIALNRLFEFREDPGAGSGNRVEGRLERTENRLIGRGKLEAAGIVTDVI
ncbi:MAG: CpaF family protein [Clostridia bacterium]|nr:CpaF family protein [Clostridia bacterium]